MTDTPQHNRPLRPLDAAVAPIRAYLDLSLEAKIALVVLSILVVWGFAIAAFGIPALVWPMKFVVPAMVLGLVMLTWGM